MREHPLFQLTLLRFREFIREPEAVFWAFAFPVVLSLGLGVAFRDQPPEPVHIAVVTPQLAQSLKVDKMLTIDEMSADSARIALRNGKVLLVAEPGPNATVIYRYDDSNPEARTARMLTDRAVQAAAGRADPVATSNDLVREPGSRYIDFLIPGMVGMGIISNAIWGIGFAIVDARRRKLMKRIVATPMPRHYYLLSFLLWRIILLPFEVGVPVIFGVVAFAVPVRGSLLEMALLCLLASLALSCVGLLLASRARTIEAVSGLANLVMMPMWVLSGVFFSSDRFPAFAQPFIKALPLTALNDALRANMLQGANLGQLVPQITVLSACLVVCFVLALKLFRWR